MKKRIISLRMTLSIEGLEFELLVGPPDFAEIMHRVVDESQDPILGDGLLVELPLALQVLERIEVVAHAVGEPDVSRGRNEVSQINKRLSAASHLDALVPG